MRALKIGFLVLLASCGPSTKRLTANEQDHYAALRVWLDDDDKKDYLRLKTEEERNAFLQRKGLWDRFYGLSKERREAILSGEVHQGWSLDEVLMAWGAPHMRKRLTGRPATRSELLVYRFEVTDDGATMVWRPDSKETHRAQRLYQVDVYVDDERITELVEKDHWE